MNQNAYDLICDPVVLVIFRRKEPTLQVLSAIHKARPKQLFIVADGPRPNVPEDEKAVAETRAVVDSFNWTCPVTKIYSDVNLGLRERVLTGLDEVFSKVNSAIILEDDCYPHQDFFVFCNILLRRYSQESRIAMVSGNNFASRMEIPSSYFFSTHSNIWGWATWSRVWKEFRSSDGSGWSLDDVRAAVSLRVADRTERKRFLKFVDIQGNLDSWAIPFSTFVHIKDMLTIKPSRNLVTNIGFGKDSTHTKFESWADEVPAGAINWPLVSPGFVDVDRIAMKKEACGKKRRSLSYPILHPFSATSRVFRYLLG